jgi:hypothetical protein
MMNRQRLLVLTWLLATGVPVVLAVVLIGCCALPFHGLVHRLLPLCNMAEVALTAHHHGDHEGHDQPAAPPSRKQDGQDGPRIAWKSEARGSLLAPLAAWTPRQVSLQLARRSQVAPGALRCDDDVGTRLALLDTLRI